MRPPSLSPEALETLLARAGLDRLAPADRADVHAVWGAVEAMLESIRRPAPGAGEVGAAAAEPSNTFAVKEAPRA